MNDFTSARSSCSLFGIDPGDRDRAQHIHSATMLRIAAVKLMRVGATAASAAIAWVRRADDDGHLTTRKWLLSAAMRPGVRIAGAIPSGYDDR